MCEHPKVSDWIQDLQFKLPRLNRQALINQACKDHNRQQRKKAAQLDDIFSEPELLSAQAHPRVLARISVNYLRGICERHYPHIAQWRGKSEFFEPYTQAKSRILHEIAAHYDWLKDECERQDIL